MEQGEECDGEPYCSDKCKKVCAEDEYWDGEECLGLPKDLDIRSSKSSYKADEKVTFTITALEEKNFKEVWVHVTNDKSAFGDYDGKMLDPSCQLSPGCSL